MIVPFKLYFLIIDHSFLTWRLFVLHLWSLTSLSSACPVDDGDPTSLPWFRSGSDSDTGYPTTISVTPRLRPGYPPSVVTRRLLWVSFWRGTPRRPSERCFCSFCSGLGVLLGRENVTEGHGKWLFRTVTLPAVSPLWMSQVEVIVFLAVFPPKSRFSVISLLTPCYYTVYQRTFEQW